MVNDKGPVGYRIAKAVLGVIFKFWYRPTLIGKEKIPKEGPILVCGNHMHLFDQCLPIIGTKRYLRYMAKKEYFDNKKTAWFFKWVGCIPVDRSIHDDNAKSLAIEHLKNGGAIGIFPEGTRNKTDQFLLPFKFGAVSMAKKTGATIVPLAVTGEYKFRTKNLVARFGEPFKVGDMTLEEANEKLFNAVKSLKEEGLKEQKRMEQIKVKVK